MNLLLRNYVLTVGRSAQEGGEPVRLVRPLHVPLGVALGHLERVPITELRRLAHDIESELNNRA